MSPLSVPFSNIYSMSPTPAPFASRRFLRRPVYATCSISPVTATFWTVIGTFVAGAGLEVAGSGVQTMVPPQVPVAGSSQKLSQVPV